MKAANKRLIIELIATGIASPVFLLLIILARAVKVIALLTLVVQPLGQLLGALLNRLFPPDGSAWFGPLGNVFLADVIVEWILVWILLMTLIKLLQRFVLTRRNT